MLMTLPTVPDEMTASEAVETDAERALRFENDALPYLDQRTAHRERHS